jgi:hypothetical protein
MPQCILKFFGFGFVLFYFGFATSWTWYSRVLGLLPLGEVLPGAFLVPVTVPTDPNKIVNSWQQPAPGQRSLQCHQQAFDVSGIVVSPAIFRVPSKPWSQTLYKKSVVQEWVLWGSESSMLYGNWFVMTFIDEYFVNSIGLLSAGSLEDKDSDSSAITVDRYFLFINSFSVHNQSINYMLKLTLTFYIR